MSFDLLEVWTPSEISAYIDNVSNGFDLLAADIGTAGRSYPVTNAKAFALALASFRSWRDGVTFLERLTLSPVRTAEQYAKQLAHFREDYRKVVGKDPTGIGVDVPSGQEGAMLSKLVNVAAFGIGAYVLAQVLTTARTFRR